MLRGFAVVLLALGIFLAVPYPTRAADPGGSDDLNQLAEEGKEQLLKWLGALIQMVPQYEMPVVDENGDIIIRRKREPAERDTPETSETRI